MSGAIWQGIAVAITGVALLTTGGSASAQLTGSRIGHRADAVTGIRLIAECYYDRDPRNVRAWLDMLPGDPAETELLQHDSEKMTACLDSNQVVFDGLAVSFRPAALRRPLGAVMARRLIIQHPDAPAPASDLAPWFVQRLTALGPAARVDRRSLAVQDFGQCVALVQWQASLALLRSSDGSAEEQAAVDRMAPSLGSCLDSGSKLTVTRRNLREIVGEPVYHILAGAVPQTGRH